MIFLASLFFAATQSAFHQCKCTPADLCWPSIPTWSALNASVDGQLIANQPIAQPCYPGPGQDVQLCQEISQQWTNSSFQETSPIGYTYPVTEECPPINGSVAAYPLCQLGAAPVYTINATKAEHVAAGVIFSKMNNVRLVVKNTGHDIVQRSQGYGSLSIWVKYVQDGLQYYENYSSPNNSCPSNWTGGAITVGGGYIWKDVYAFASEHNSIVVGGDDRTVGAIGGFLQGGGHGPVSHEFGLAADQVLEYKVVLASGQLVKANACQYTDLFIALRGGGGGTFGVVVSATIKAHPTRPTLAHTLAMTPLYGNITDLLNATGDLLSKYPIISDRGFGGNGELLHMDGETLYTHTFIMLLENSSSISIESAKQFMNTQILKSLLPLNGSKLSITSSFNYYSTFQEYMLTGKHQAEAEDSLLMVSRLFNKDSLNMKEENLIKMLEVLFIETGQGARPAGSGLSLCLVGGGKVLQPDPYTSVNPAWRKAYTLLAHVDLYPLNAGLEGVQQVRDKATSKKLKVMEELTPGMGTYLNEADGFDPQWKESWFGHKYDWLKTVKQRYDPEGVFWCWRCVGNEDWEEVKGGATYGPLCTIK
ncbi:FAD-binding type 2 [Penicillium taxi]|uniref:FAD-binding type 2 n=1 Tax=Penicillium taxi TaxID=168475 RepID=UPI0025452AF1|nr:FAD-binding type 2 [Penicillium taxi]KAJ5907621.1 FAD-binding type 2 [Penicillium taxi]